MGKTVATGCLGRYFLDEKKQRVVTQKWVQSGCKTVADHDCTTHYQWMGQPLPTDPAVLKAMMPYTFSFPASAHLAAGLEGARVQVPRLLASLRFLEARYDMVLVEGLGGVAVPLTANVTLLDVLEQTRLQTVVVVDNVLGAINHALLTLEALAARKVPVAGFIDNRRCAQTDPRIADDNVATIARLSGSRCFGRLEREGGGLHLLS